MLNALNRPGTLKIVNIKTWVEEQIWGHRFHNDQTPWMLMLEFLGLCANRLQVSEDGRVFPGFFGTDHEEISYTLQTRETLRYLLFQDRHLEDCLREPFTSDASRFDVWVGRASADADTDFHYLKRAFVDFGSLANAISLLRSAEVEQQHNRRPSSRHLAPQGATMLMADYNPKGGSATQDRRFFSRGGELLYLMLNRSQQRERLDELIRTRLLRGDNPWCNLVERLTPPMGGSRNVAASVGYLPLPTHARYDRIAEDWTALLSLPGLPNDYLLEPLVGLSGLGIMLYLIERAAETLGRAGPPPVPVDMISAGNTALRKLSIEHFHQHRQLTRDAVKHAVCAVEQTDAWKQAVVSDNPNPAATAVLADRFLCEKMLRPKQSPAQQINAVVDQALKNHNTHLGLVGGAYAQASGLAIARKGAGRWYALSDSLLEALVLANVREPLEYSEFLDRLHKRYHLVVGPVAAENAFDDFPAPREQFKTNQERLEERLRVLGLLRRLSDDCAFVENPFV